MVENGAKQNMIFLEIKYEINNNKNWNIKIYDYFNKLMFEGEYKNGEKWNGKIKEYDDYYDRLIIEVEYANDSSIKAPPYTKILSQNKIDKNKKMLMHLY